MTLHSNQTKMDINFRFIHEQIKQVQQVLLPVLKTSTATQTKTE